MTLSRPLTTTQAEHGSAASRRQRHSRRLGESHVVGSKIDGRGFQIEHLTAGHSPAFSDDLGRITLAMPLSETKHCAMPSHRVCLIVGDDPASDPNRINTDWISLVAEVELLGKVTVAATGCSLDEIHLGNTRWLVDPMICHLLNALRMGMPTSKREAEHFHELLCHTLLTYLIKRHAQVEGVRGRNAGGLAAWHMRKIDHYIDENLDSNLTLDAMASLVKLSRSHFARSFRESTGQTPHRYLIARRIAKARQLLLDSDQTILEIALSVGCTDHSHLTRIFRRELGVTPSELRLYVRSLH